MNWDDLRFVGAVARHGSLLHAGKELRVDHTTVGRRIAAAEDALGVRLFSRSTTGLVLTADGERLLAPLGRVEDAVHTLLRQAGGETSALAGAVKVTAPESFGIAWLAPRLAAFAQRNQGLRIELDPSGAVADLNRREAEVALRTVRSKDQSLAVRRACTIGYGVYAAQSLLARTPIRRPADLRGQPLLASEGSHKAMRWFAALTPGTAAPVFSCVVGAALAAAAKTGAGVTVLPHYLGAAEPELVYLPMPDEPADTLWLTVHRDLRATPRVRAVLDFVVDACRRDATLLRGPTR